MAKKLLLKVFTFWALILTSALGWGQECVSTPPTVTITNETGSATLCKDGTTTDTPITFTSNSISSAQSYQWEVQVGSGAWTPISGAISANLSYSNATLGSNRFRLVVTYCDSEEPNADNEVTSTQSGIIAVYEKKEGKITIAASNTDICPGETVTFTTSNPGNLGATPDYSWRVNATQLGTGSTFSRSDLTEGDNVQLFVTSTVPCVDIVQSNIITFTEKPGTPATPGNISITSGLNEDGMVCPNSSVTLSIVDVDRASSYKWTLPSGWTGQTTGTEITVTTGAVGNGKVVKVEAINDCGTTENSTSINVGPGKPTTPGAITVDTTLENDLICEAGSVTLTVPNDSSVKEYIWTLPTGWSISSGEGTNKVTVTVGNFGQNGTASVIAKNACLNSDTRNVTLSINDPVPATPGTISGESVVCPNIDVTYSISAVNYADSYIWTLPNGTEVTTQIPEVTFNSGTPGENKILNVRATNECGESGSSNDKSIDVDNGTPDEITITSASGNSEFCPQESGIVFTVPADAKVDTFTWTVSSGWSIVSGQGTNQLTVTSGTLNQDGNIQLTASSNLCGSVSASFPVTVKNPAPSTAGESISGEKEVCATSTNLVYEIPPIEFADEYVWQIPSNWSVVSGDDSNRITVNAGTDDGVISVYTLNECGNSGDPLEIAVTSTDGAPDAPVLIESTEDFTENPNVCPPYTGMQFEIDPVDGATKYEWKVPVGWSITSGAGTTSVTVSASATGSYNETEVVQVRAGNNCYWSEYITSFSIIIDDYIITDVGPDKTLCSTVDQVQIDANVVFGNSKFTPTLTATGRAANRGFQELPGNSGVSGSFSFYYTPVQADLARGSVTIKMTVPRPNGNNTSCGTGEDEMTIFFLPDPTASISGTTDICTGTSTDLTFNGTPNTTVTYKVNGGSEQSIALGSTGAATLSSSVLNAADNSQTEYKYEIVSVGYTDTPTCTQTPTTDNIATITVNPTPDVDISYSGPFCDSQTTAQLAFENGVGAWNSGEFSATGDLGLNINSSDGSFVPEDVDPGSYTVTYTIQSSGGCGEITSITEVVIFEQVSISSQPVEARSCEGGSAQFEVTATGDGLTYEWFKGSLGSGTPVAGATAPILVLENLDTSDVGSYYVEVSGSSPCEMVRSSLVNLIVDENITITQQPADNTICLSDTATLSVLAEAGDETLNYQWYKGDPDSTNRTAIGAANTTGELELTETTTASSGNYYVVISGSDNFTCEEVTSQVAVLNVRDVPVVQISGDAEICDGGDTELYFTNGTTSAIVTYTVNNGNQETITLDAAGEATLSTGALTVTNNDVTTYTYALVRIEYPDAPICSNTVTGSATVTVNPTPNVDVSFENDQITFCNDTIQESFTPNLQGSGKYEGGTFSAEGLNVNPETGSFSPANATAGEYTLKYFLTGSGGCSDLAATLDINIYEQVKITSQPFPVPVCTANTTQLEVAATGDGLSYEWFKVGGTSPVSTGNIYTISNATAEDAGDYYVMVGGDNACTPVQSETVTVTVDENIVVTQQPSNQNVCLAGDVTLNVNATASGSNENIQYRWMYRPAGSTNENDWSYVDGGETQTLNISEISGSQAGQYRAEIDGPDGFSCSLGYSEAATITIYEAPTADAGAATLEVCSTTNPINIGEGSSAANFSSVEWTTTNGQGSIDNSDDLTGAIYVPAEADFGLAIEFNLSAILQVDGVELCAETDASDTKLITIIPQSEITEFSYPATEFCETDLAEQKPTTDVKYSDSGSGVYTVVANQESSTPLSVDSATGAFTPNGTTPGTYVITYTFTANSKNGTCTTASEEFTVTIGEQPSAEFTYGEAPFCSDAANPSPTSVNNGHLGTFSSTTGLVFLEGGELGQVDLVKSDPGTYTVINTVDFEGDGCQPVEFEATIIINAQPAAPEVVDVVYCHNEEGATALSATTDTGATLNWYSSEEAETALETAPVPSTATITETPVSYWVSQTSAAGCESVRVEMTVTINELPEVLITVDESVAISDAGNPVICFGSSIVLSGNGATEYAWSTEIDNLGSSLNLTVSPEVTTTYNVTGTDENNCSSTVEITVEVDELSLGGSISGSTNVCLGSNSGTLNLIDQRGEVVRWESSVDDWATVVTIDNTTTSLAYSSLTLTTAYHAVVQNGVCNEILSETATITVDPISVGGNVFVQGTTDKTLLVCHRADEDSVTPLELVGAIGEVVRWEFSTNSGTSWTTVPVDDTPRIQGYEGITETRLYRAILKSGSCSEVPSAVAIVSVIPNQKPTPVEAKPHVVCLGEDVELLSESGFATGRNLASGGTFNNANPEGWLADGCGNCLNAGGSNTKETGFRLSATNGGTYSGVEYTSDNKFAISNGDYNSIMETPVFNLIGITEGSLEFSHSYKLVGDAEIYVEISTDGGSTYSSILWEQRDPDELTPHQNFHNSSATKMNLDLSTYLGESNLRIRFVYRGTTGSSWAIDNIAIPDAPVDERMEWVDEQTGEVISTTETATVTPLTPGINTYRVTSYINGCRSFGEEGTEIVEVFAYDSYTAEAGIAEGQNLICGQNAIHIFGKIHSYYQQSLDPENDEAGYIQEFPEGDTSTARWIVKGLTEEESNSYFDNPSSPNAVFTAEAGTYILEWTIDPGNAPGEENNPCSASVAEVEITIKNCDALNFDGEDDVVVIEDAYSGVASIEAWVRPEVAGGTIISGPNFHITTPSDITPGSRWYHIAVSNGKLYVDGVEKSNLSLGDGVGSQTTIGAEFINGKATNFFSGWIEEVRLWKKALTVEQIRFMMNQRLIANGAQMGEQIPMNVPGTLTYTDLAGYYRLISAEPEPLAVSPVVYLAEDMPANGMTPDRATNKAPGRLINMETNQNNTAPLPYYSGANGIWGTNATWLRPDVWEPPHTGAIEWNIVRTSHDITSGSRDILILGLISEVNTLNMEGDNPNSWTTGGTGNQLYLSHYLLLDGIIDLNGESQLLQLTGSIVDGASTGHLDRDQQGTASSYNYNYWSSPVSPGAGNAAYTVGAVMMDGTTPTPVGVNFGDPYAHADGTATTPRKVSTYWLHRFHGTANNYFEWDWIGAGEAFAVGEGYSMKGTTGPAAILDSQNYTFRGLPNNGTVTPGTTGTDENYLIGNPYPSAIDANKFIADNLTIAGSTNVFNGTVYFWSHFAEKTHYLEDYVGGYAAYNLSGGVRAVAIDERINATEAEGGQVPQQFIPVGQAFFINTMVDSSLDADIQDDDLPSSSQITGGEVTFKNSQRVFAKEATGSSVFHSQEKKGLTSGTSNSSSSEVEQNKIWLKFKSPKGYHRQILVTADERATDNFDLGFDAPMIEDNVEDMYWYFSNYQFVIQGVSDFNINRELNLGMKVDEKGPLTISIDDLENISDEMDIFLKDSLHGIVHDLREKDYVTESEPGIFTDRFKLVFQDETAVIDPEEPVIIDEGPFEVLYVTGTRNVLVRNPELLNVDRIYLNNMLGQQVHVYYDVPEDREVELPVKRFSAGVYIVKVHYEGGIITKKVILE